MGIKKANNNFKNKYKKSEKFKIGCEAVGGKPVDEIFNETGMSRNHIYRQKASVMQYAEGLDKVVENNVPTLQLTPKIIKRTVLSLALDCQSPYSGIQFFIKNIYGITISKGTIHNILKEASERAKEFDDTIDLSNISQMALDEIFQCGKPILTGVDAESTYVFAMEPMNDRSGEAWNLILDDAKDRGLNPDTSISDSAKGLLSGVERTFSESKIQADTFHASYDLGKEISKCERRANKLISAESELKRKLNGVKPRNPEKIKKALEDNTPKMNEAINTYDQLNMLYLWLKMLLGFSGYGLIDSQMLIEWILLEMRILAAGNTGLLAEIEKIERLVPNLLLFVRRLEQKFDEIAVNSGVPPDICHQIYRQLTYLPCSSQGIEEQCNIVNVLQDKYDDIQKEVQSAMHSTKKASSIVENLNGRIRVYIEVKRIIPAPFFILLKVYFNTKRYTRSRCEERKGKSPLELLIRAQHQDFFEVIGF